MIAQLLNIVLYLIATFDSTLKIINIVHTLVKYEDKGCKIVIDGGSCINVISTYELGRIKVMPKLQPHPYKATWVDQTSLFVKETRLSHANLSCMLCQRLFIGRRIVCSVKACSQEGNNSSSIMIKLFDSILPNLER